MKGAFLIHTKQGNAILYHILLAESFICLLVLNLGYKFGKILIMKNINTGDKVKYTSETNDYTFRNDIFKNSTGIVKKVIEVDGLITYLVEFENGITASIDLNDVEKF